MNPAWLDWLYAIAMTAAIIGIPTSIVVGITEFLWWWKFTKGRG